MREPDWTRDELVLALEFYVRTERSRLNERNPAVVELSDEIRALPIHGPSVRTSTFRSPQSIKSKLENFHSLQHPGHGLRRGGKLDRRIFEEFSDRQPALADAAAHIRSGSILLGGMIVDLGPDDDDAAEREGAILLSLHQRRERSSRLVRRKKQNALRRTGRLQCEACDIDFATRYGATAFGIMECHHSKPLSSLEKPENTRLRDLALLCPNCHRAIHRIFPLPTIIQFKQGLQQSGRY